jgi:predicted dehydrogenase
MATTISKKEKILNVGIIGCSAFAFRAMGPAIQECPGFRLSAIASRSAAKAHEAGAKLDCRAVEGYEELIEDPEIDVIYMPLPTGLHLEWGMRVLDAGKHLLIEKSLAGEVCEADSLVAAARRNKLALLENFLFLRHSQIRWVKEQLAEGIVGRLRLVRAIFTIPTLDDENFRYSKRLGGGALLDTGAYMAKTVAEFFGEEVELLDATIQDSAKRGVDIGGTATFQGISGLVAQVAWGFDCHYQCTWEFLGESGRILCTRALTPPPGFRPQVFIEKNSQVDSIALDATNHYVNQWNYFLELTQNAELRELEYQKTLRQAQMLENINRIAKKSIIL